MKTLKQDGNKMDLLNNKENQKVKARLLESMLDFIEDDEEAEYTTEDVAQCDSILKNFLIKSSELADREAFLQKVKETVVALNELNEKVNHSIIETDQREDICEIIIHTGFLLGFNKKDEDITEEWRNW